MKALVGFPLLSCLLIRVGATVDGVDGDHDGVDDAVDVCSNTPDGVPVDGDGRPIGDLDLDCDVDELDFAAFQAAFTGPCLPEVCDDGVDNDCDQHIDCADVEGCPLGTRCGESDEVCVIGGLCGCAGGFSNCDGLAENGCETDVLTDANHCGDCLHVCNLSHATGGCSQGHCAISTCEPGFKSCDSIPDNGCETPVTTLVNCGSCGVTCSLPNASENCLTGSCAISNCQFGFANCDANAVDGCEVNLLTATGSCASPLFWGAPCGDQVQNLASQVGRGGKWFRVSVQECVSDSPFVPGTPFRVTIDLVQIPVGVDYDLYVYGACATLLSSSSNGLNAAEQVVLSWPDSIGPDDGRDLFIEVRFFSGESCGNWTLNVRGG